MIAEVPALPAVQATVTLASPATAEVIVGAEGGVEPVVAVMRGELRKPTPAAFVASTVK